MYSDLVRLPVRRASQPPMRGLLLWAALGPWLTSVGVAQSLDEEPPVAPNMVRPPGLVQYDAEEVPTIVTHADEDAAWLLGHTHAAHRMFQMDVLRRTAHGTLAELLGPEMLAQDVELRTLGIGRSVTDALRQLPRASRSQVKAYGAGVNAWLCEHTEHLPEEYGQLELTRIEPWRSEDTLAISKLLSFELSFDLDTNRTLQYQAYVEAGAVHGFDGNALFFEDTQRFSPRTLHSLKRPQPLSMARKPGPAGLNVTAAAALVLDKRVCRCRVPPPLRGGHCILPAVISNGSLICRSSAGSWSARPATSVATGGWLRANILNPARH